MKANGVVCVSRLRRTHGTSNHFSHSAPLIVMHSAAAPLPQISHHPHSHKLHLIASTLGQQRSTFCFSWLLRCSGSWLLRCSVPAAVVLGVVGTTAGASDTRPGRRRVHRPDNLIPRLPPHGAQGNAAGLAPAQLRTLVRREVGGTPGNHTFAARPPGHVLLLLLVVVVKITLMRTEMISLRGQMCRSIVTRSITLPPVYHHVVSVVGVA